MVALCSCFFRTVRNRQQCLWISPELGREPRNERLGLECFGYYANRTDSQRVMEHHHCMMWCPYSWLDLAGPRPVNASFGRLADEHEHFYRKRPYYSQLHRPLLGLISRKIVCNVFSSHRGIRSRGAFRGLWPTKHSDECEHPLT